MKQFLTIGTFLSLLLAFVGCGQDYKANTPEEGLAGWKDLQPGMVPPKVQTDVSQFVAKASTAEGWKPTVFYFYYTKPTGETAVTIYYSTGHISWERLLFYNSNGVRTNAVRLKYAYSIGM